MKVSVLGSGGWGTALALLLHDNAHQVTLWSHNESKACRLSQTRSNALLPGIPLAEDITVTSDLKHLREAQIVVFAAPSFALRQVARQAAPFLNRAAILVSVTKGIEDKTFLRMSQILAQECGQNRRICVLSGPSHAEEVSRRIATGCVAAAAAEADALAVQSTFMNSYFRVYTHNDVAGVELAGALKNVAALCCGISDGLGLGDNTRALLITRALSEVSRLCERMGGQKETLAGLAGIGDMIVTCCSMHSRNRRAGILIGQGVPPQEALAQIGAVVEGFYATKSAMSLSEAQGVEMPICSGAYRILYENAGAAETAQLLMNRQPRHELDSSWV